MQQFVDFLCSKWFRCSHLCFLSLCVSLLCVLWLWSSKKDQVICLGNDVLLKINAVSWRPNTLRVLFDSVFSAKSASIWKMHENALQAAQLFRCAVVLNWSCQQRTWTIWCFDACTARSIPYVNCSNLNSAVLIGSERSSLVHSPYNFVQSLVVRFCTTYFRFIGIGCLQATKLLDALRGIVWSARRLCADLEKKKHIYTVAPYV